MKIAEKVVLVLTGALVGCEEPKSEGEVTGGGDSRSFLRIPLNGKAQRDPFQDVTFTEVRPLVSGSEAVLNATSKYGVCVIVPLDLSRVNDNQTFITSILATLQENGRIGGEWREATNISDDGTDSPLVYAENGAGTEIRVFCPRATESLVCKFEINDPRGNFATDMKYDFNIELGGSRKVMMTSGQEVTIFYSQTPE